ncbi:MAG: hypothetical protein PHV82_18660 [Victivallaceae bacterium]|nr:hypothetical protein [Victivallaceae bacterium]
MRTSKLFTLVLLCGGVFAARAAKLPQAVVNINQFQEFRLAQGEIYELYVKFGNGVTTVTFPSAISKIVGVNVAADGSGDFLIAAKPGAYYFNLVALKKGAAGTLTVIYNRQTYILYLKQDDKKAFAAVNFAAGSGGGSSLSGKAGGVTPARLLSFIDMAKGYHILKQRYPSELRDSICAANHRFFDFGKFRIELKEVIRFNREDTLVFKLLMHNNKAEEIAYDRFSFSVQLGGKTYYMSAADASGVMPPKSATWAFFTITGTPDGGCNNLAPDNDFMIGVTAKYMENDYRFAAGEPVPEKKTEASIAKRIPENRKEIPEIPSETEAEIPPENSEVPFTGEISAKDFFRFPEILYPFSGRIRFR